MTQFFESGRRGSNSPPIAWKAIALPNELLPLVFTGALAKMNNFTHVSAMIYFKADNDQRTFQPTMPDPWLILWAVVDSNHRSRKTADLQSAPFGRSGICPNIIFEISKFPGATCRNRTNDLLITNQLLYQLS